MKNNISPSVNKNKKFKKPKPSSIIITALLCFYGLIILYPFYSSFLTSIVPYGVAVKNKFLLYPPELDFSSYQFIFSWKSLLYGFRTTFIVVLLGVPYNLFLTVTLAYVLSKPIPGRRLVNSFVVFTMFFQGGLIPGYLLIKNMGLIDNYAAMILPFGISIMNMMIMRSYFQGLPEEMREAAKIDGAGEIMILVRIALPLSKPMLATIALYYGVDRWNEWYNGMLFMRSVEKWPLQLHIRNMIQSIGSVVSQIPESIRPNAYPTGIQMAGIIITILPVAIIYPFLQKYFVKGLTLGGVKG
ncbi:MAG: binding-protein-dependent transport system inner rane component [Herbinix sp.]|jgi:putative aldouronate transport system permease protein|nr:binding-protein-dependent transport system inner rane component [Herbinix sp.]